MLTGTSTGKTPFRQGMGMFTYDSIIKDLEKQFGDVSVKLVQTVNHNLVRLREGGF